MIKIIKILINDPRVDPTIDDHKYIPKLVKLIKKYNDHNLTIALFNNSFIDKQFLLELLIENKININLLPFYDFINPIDAILIAAKSNNIDVIETLINNPDLDPTVQNNQLIVDLLHNNHTDIVKLLFQKFQIDPSIPDNKLIRIAVKNNQIDIVKLLLPDPRVDPSVYRNYPLILAIQRGHTEIVKLLLQHPNVDPSARDNDPIIEAVNYNHIEIVKLLLQDPRVDPNAQNFKPLLNSIDNNHFDITKLLLKHPRVDPSINSNTILRFFYIHKRNIGDPVLKKQVSDIINLLLNDPRVLQNDLSFLSPDVVLKVKSDYIINVYKQSKSKKLKKELILPKFTTDWQEICYSITDDNNLTQIKKIAKTVGINVDNIVIKPQKDDTEHSLKVRLKWNICKLLSDHMADVTVPDIIYEHGCQEPVSLYGDEYDYIPDNQLVIVYEQHNDKKFKYCFTLQEAENIIKNKKDKQPLINPYTRKPLPDDFVQNYQSKLKNKPIDIHEVKIRQRSSSEKIKAEVQEILDKISDVYPYPIDTNLYKISGIELVLLFKFIAIKIQQSGLNLHLPPDKTIKGYYSKGKFYGIKFLFDFYQDKLDLNQIGMLINTFFDYLIQFKDYNINQKQQGLKPLPLSQFIDFVITQES